MSDKKRPRAAREAATRASSPDLHQRDRFERILAESPSPFSDAVLPNAFRETPDVPTLHANAREACLGHIRQARETGRTTLQVVTGDPGDGKTHLLAWLRRTSEESWRKTLTTGRFALTVIPPLRALSRLNHHVLQEVVRQLSIRLPGTIHVDEATDTPIEILVWRALLAIASIVGKDKSTAPELRLRLEELTGTDPDRFLAMSVEQLKHLWPDIGRALVDAALRTANLELDREIFRVVAQFPEGDESERTTIVDWLGGASFSSERLDSLGTALVLDDEPGATRALKTLLSMARLAGTPVVIAFDQIEGTTRLGSEAIPELLATITELYNDVPGSVLLVFCQTQLWPELRAAAPEHVRDRLDDTKPVHLRPLEPEDAFLLVSTRMKKFWSSIQDGPEDPLYPLSKETVSTHVARAKLRSPRAVIRYFQALLREPADRRAGFDAPEPVAPAEIVRRKLAALVEESRATIRPPDARASVAQAVVGDSFAQATRTHRSIGGVAVERSAPLRVNKTGTLGIELVLRKGSERRRVYIEGSNSENGKSAASTIKRLADAIESGKADTALLLRDEALPLPPAARRALIELTPRGAIVRIREGEVVELAAIEALLNAAAAGDVPVDRETALDLAIAQGAGTTVALEERIVETVFAAHAEGSEAPSETAPPSLDSYAIANQAEQVLELLRSKRAFSPTSHIARALGVPLETVDSALRLLVERRAIDIVADRNRAPVVLLRPEGLRS